MWAQAFITNKLLNVGILPFFV